jgi:hypothetical protein
MGKQIQFHMLADDMQAFLNFAQSRDPLVITRRDWHAAQIECLPCPWLEENPMILWNQGLLSQLERNCVGSGAQSYYRVHSSSPVLELIPNRKVDWNGSPALLQGRIYGVFDQSTLHASWYAALASWIRRNFKRIPIPELSGYVGPSACRWFHDGGLLLPMVSPPQDSTWNAILRQHQARYSPGQSR